MKFTSLVTSLLSVGLAHAQPFPDDSSTTNLRGGGEKNVNTMDDIENHGDDDKESVEGLGGGSLKEQ